MTTYLINHLRIPNGVPKPERWCTSRVWRPTFKPYGGKWLVLDAPVEVLEGEWPRCAVLMEFPDMDTARNWYDSPEYQRIVRLRTETSSATWFCSTLSAPTSRRPSRSTDRTEIAAGSDGDS